MITWKKPLPKPESDGGSGTDQSDQSDQSGQYTVGYKSPPKHTRFKPGQSGNPKGRPKGVKNLSTDLSEELNETIIVTESGKTIQVTKQRAVIKTLIAKSLKGDVRATHTLIDLIVGVEQSDQNKTQHVDVLSEDDQQILDVFKQKILSKSNTHLPLEADDASSSDSDSPPDYNGDNP